MKRVLKIITIIAFSTLLFGIELSGCASTATTESSGQYIDSSVITTKVKTKLAKNIAVKTVSSIDVTTYKGVVQLSGFVRTKQEMIKAGKIAKSVTGVKSVNNNLIVRSQIK